MKFTLIVDPEKDEEIVATVHARSPLTDTIESLLLQHSGSGQLAAFTEEDITILPYDRIACITVQNSKTFAIDIDGNRFRLRQRLYELEEMLKAKHFLRISKPMLVNLMKIKSIQPAFNGRFTAVLSSGEKIIISRSYVKALKAALKGK